MRRFIILSVIAALAGCGAQSSLTPVGKQATLQMRSAATNYRVLYSFKGHPDGGEPGHGPLVVLDGNLYGTTRYGGSNGPGAVFEITPDGSERVVYSFAGSGKGDGSFPLAGLAVLNGALYGTTQDGGSGGSSYGTVFEVTKAGKERIVYNFDGYTGAYPAGRLDVDAGVLYGTTNNYGKEFDGTLFAVTTDGKLKSLHQFGRKGDGARPYAGPQFFGGKIYGTTLFGPADSDLSGIVYEQPVTGRLRFVHRFGVRAGDGAKPYGRLAMHNGDLYGTTELGGQAGHGIVFKLTIPGTETVLHSFECATGCEPVAGLAIAGGKLYGETVKGGASNKGVIFEITPGGTYRVLQQFNGTDGSEGTSELLSWNGKLFGTTRSGGAHGHGTVFEITP